MPKIQRYQFHDLTEKQQEELKEYATFVEKFVEFQRTATQEIFNKIFWLEGDHLWEQYINRTEKNLFELVFKKFMRPAQVNQLFYYLMHAEFIDKAMLEQGIDIVSPLRRRYGFMNEIITFGHKAKPTTFRFLFDAEGHTLWYRFKMDKDCDGDGIKFVLGHYLSEEQKLLLYSNILMYAKGCRFEHFPPSQTSMFPI